MTQGHPDMTTQARQHCGLRISDCGLPALNAVEGRLALGRGPAAPIRNPKSAIRNGIAAALFLAFALSSPCFGERIKDIADVKGVRGNPIWAYGLVIGLNGTGDDSPLSRRALTNILRRSGLVLDPADLASKNIASVIVTAELPPFGRSGSQIDVTVSAIGNATSLQGGTLLTTPLVAADGQVYAVAQGPVSIGGFSASGENATVSKNHATAGRVPNGATIEKEELATFVENGALLLQLRNPDFTTARNVAQAVADVQQGATAVDAATIRVPINPKFSRAETVALIDRISNLDVKVDQPAIVVINERTGTIIVGEKVTISSVAISHGNLSIVTEEKDYVSQPLPFSEKGSTEKVHRTDIQVKEDKGKMVVVPRVSVSELAKALNAMGMTPRDLIAIFEALRQAGALQAQLKVI
jgi:flagellar P-ring protein FlgI